MRASPLHKSAGRLQNGFCDNQSRAIQEQMMKILFSVLVAASMLTGCISSSNPPPPAKTTVVVPQNSGTTVVVCQDGTQPPCR